MLVPVITYIAAITLFIQFVYGLCILTAVLRHRKTGVTNTNPVSVIVCAHNELQNIEKLLPKLKSQNHPDFEIIIIDDRSDDGTYDFLLDAKGEQVKVVTINQVHDHINAKKFAITMGVKAAKNDILLFIDADCTPKSNNWILEMTACVQPETEFVLGVSMYEKRKGFLNLFIRYETLLTAINYIGFAICGNPYMGVGRNLAYRKSMFLKSNGFNKYQHVTGGDDDLLVNHRANKSNTMVSLGEEALTISQPRTTWSGFFQQKIRHISVSKYYRFKDKVLLGLQNMSSSLFWIALISLAIVSNQYLIPGALFLLRIILVVNLAYLTSKKLGDRINPWLLPIMDLIYVPYIMVLGSVAILTKKVKWKK